MSVAGTYKIVTKTPMGDQNGTFTVNVSGDSFTGGVAGPMGAMEVTDGKVDGNTLTWKMDMKVPMPMTLECEAVCRQRGIVRQDNVGLAVAMLQKLDGRRKR